MLYIISGDEKEAKEYAESIHKKDWMFIPDSEFSMVFRKNTDYQIVFIGSYKKRRDIISRLMEARDRLIYDTSLLQKNTIYNKNGDIVSQNEFSYIEQELEAYKKVEKFYEHPRDIE